MPYSLAKVPCDVCSSELNETILTEDIGDIHFHIVKCSGCGLVYTNPRPTDSSLEAYYSEHYDTATLSGLYCLDGRKREQNFSRSLRMLAGYKRSGKLLDVGCGAGFFLDAARNFGNWQVCGIEPSSYACGLARKRIGSNVLNCTLKEAGFQDAEFDIVSLWYVLEHVSSPISLLREAKRILKPEGLLLVAVPNLNYLLLKRRITKLFATKPASLYPHEHLYQFSLKTIRMVLGRVGLETIAIDVDAPFILKSQRLNIVKQVLIHGVRILYRATGIHLGGLLTISQET
jgi:SAM-dependent methyltransferase